MKHQDLRTPEEKFGDLLADDVPFNEIADRLGWSGLQVRNRYLRVCREVGERPDEE